jgi:hypothetical protein
MLQVLNPSLVLEASSAFFASIPNTRLATSFDSTLSGNAFFALNQPGAKVRPNEGNAELWMRADGQNPGRSARLVLGTAKTRGGKGQGRKLRKLGTVLPNYGFVGRIETAHSLDSG